MTEAALLTPADVAARYKCSTDTVLKWIKSGRLPALKITDSKRPLYRVHPESLEGFNQMVGDKPRRFQGGQWY
jgi:excisionase family DNA binding protein